MIKITNTETYGWEACIRGMRNPLNSWDKSDSYFMGGIDTDGMSSPRCWCIGNNDLTLMKKLGNAGPDHGKYLRMINVTLDITAPLYWWKEFDTYKVGTVANSCSTMHKIHAKPFEWDDFSFDHLCERSCKTATTIIEALNFWREQYLETKNKEDWWQLIQLLPSSYNQKRTVQLNYQVLKNMYHARKNHKLDCWKDFCSWIETLPYAEDLICG